MMMMMVINHVFIEFTYVRNKNPHVTRVSGIDGQCIYILRRDKRNKPPALTNYTTNEIRTTNEILTSSYSPPADYPPSSSSIQNVTTRARQHTHHSRTSRANKPLNGGFSSMTSACTATNNGTAHPRALSAVQSKWNVIRRSIAMAFSGRSTEEYVTDPCTRAVLLAGASGEGMGGGYRFRSSAGRWSGARRRGE